MLESPPYNALIFSRGTNLCRESREMEFVAQKYLLPHLGEARKGGGERPKFSQAMHANHLPSPWTLRSPIHHTYLLIIYMGWWIWADAVDAGRYRQVANGCRWAMDASGTPLRDSCPPLPPNILTLIGQRTVAW